MLTKDVTVGPVAEFIIRRAFQVGGQSPIDHLRYLCSTIDDLNQLRGVSLVEDAALTACLSSGGPRNAHLEGDCYPGTASIDEEGITFNALPETAILAILRDFEPGMRARSLVEISGFPDLRIKRVVPLETISGPRMLRCVFDDNKPSDQRLDAIFAELVPAGLQTIAA